MSQKWRTKIGNVQLYPFNSSNLEVCLEKICEKPVTLFDDLKIRDIPETPGVYLITDCRRIDLDEQSFYVGKSLNLKQRIQSHKSGNEGSSPTIRYLVSDDVEDSISDRYTAREFIRANLGLRWLEFSDFNLSAEQGIEKSIGYVEAYLVAQLQPLYGIYNPYRKNFKK